LVGELESTKSVLSAYHRLSASLYTVKKGLNLIGKSVALLNIMLIDGDLWENAGASSTRRGRGTR
jgi:hypothetical protein